MSRFWQSGLLGGSPTLQILSVSPNNIDENSAPGVVVGAVQNLTATSTLTITDTAGSRFALSGNNIVTGATSTDYESATFHNITLHEVLAGATNTPRDTIIRINVNDLAEGGTISAPVLTRTSADGTNRMSWQGFYPVEHRVGRRGHWRQGGHAVAHQRRRVAGRYAPCRWTAPTLLSGICFAWPVLARQHPVCWRRFRRGAGEASVRYSLVASSRLPHPIGRTSSATR
jgi:hypothetical protein